MWLGADVLLVSLQVRRICAAHLVTADILVSSSNQPGLRQDKPPFIEHAAGLPQLHYMHRVTRGENKRPAAMPCTEHQAG